ncbi:MAG: hypothetical protein N2246_03245 [Candidatus Sumerlaeia bacterium]|nr:hypothetical protein [Candidatus Sumerlaeia bacterium]
MKHKLGVILSIILLAGAQVFSQDTSDLFRKLEELRWVSYSPTNMNPNQGIWPSETSLRQDLQTLRNYGFQGIATYSAYNILGKIPQLAREIGFEGVIMGLWNFPQVDPVAGQIEWNNALLARNFVDAYCVGNEGILAGRYSLAVVAEAVNSLRNTTRKPVTTNEELSVYFNTPGLLDLGDWIYPNIHPYWAGVKEPLPAVQWTVEKFNLLQQSAPGRFISCKELGLPTAGDSACSAERQAEYYYRLCGTNVRFHFFEAYDQLWKTSQPVEPYWGLFHSNRTPKQFIQQGQIILTEIPPIGSFQNLSGKCLNVNPSLFGITAFIFVPGAGWWIKPTFAQCVADINPDNTWSLDITTGGIDEQATKINVFVVPKNFNCYSSQPTSESSGTTSPAIAAWTVERFSATPTPTPTPVPAPCNFTFTNDSEGWWFAGAIPPFSMPSAIFEAGHVGLSPQGATNCFSYWSSPQLQVEQGKIYRTRWRIESDATNPDITLDFRLRCNQLSNWRFWDTGVYSYNLSAPSAGNPRVYDCIIFPQMQTPTDIIQLSFDILSFDPLNALNSWIYLDEVSIDEVTITP